MTRRVTLDQVKRALRARVCQHCPLRRPGEAVQLDPMIQSVPAVLQHKITRAIESIHNSRDGYDGRSSPLNRHRRCVIHTLTELVD